MMKIPIPRCPHPKCGARMVRAYVREKGQFVPIGWWCRECGETRTSCPFDHDV